MDNIKQYINVVAEITEGLGVLTIFLGSLYAVFVFFRNAGKKIPFNYVLLRQNVGKSILMGLEFLIAADIMATVVTEPTLRSVVILGIIVLIRTFLSLSLQVELEGSFPWQRKNEKTKNNNKDLT